MLSQRRPSHRRVKVLVGVFVVGAISVGISLLPTTKVPLEYKSADTPADQRTLPKPTPAPQGYVGGEACRRCHQQIWEQYQSHSMSRSSAIVNEAASIEDFDQRVSFETQTSIGAVKYRVDRTDEGQFHHESLTDPVLGQVYDQGVKIEFTIGSGKIGRTYLHVQKDCFFVSPIAWYPQGAKWDLSLGYRPGKHPRFERKVTQLCLTCHTDRVVVDEEYPERFNLKSIQGAAISCERCHGPGRDHISFHDRSPNQANFIPDTTDPIVNPNKLDSERRESVCWQCHFSAEDRVLRYGRTHADFRPGMNFDDIWVPFVRNDVDTSIPVEPVNHVEQILVSQCYRRSEGRFGCLSCHDAHSLPSLEEKDRFYRAKCLACHNERGCSVPVDERILTSESDSCVECHMPPQRMDRLSHTSQTDHRILRTPVLRQATARKSELAIFHFGSRHLTQLDQDLAWGRYLGKEAESKRNMNQARLAESKLAAVLKAVPDDDEIQEVLGGCEALLGQTDRAKVRWRKILEHRPNTERVLLRLAVFSTEQNDLTTARHALIRYLQINPWNSDAQTRLAAIYAYEGQFEAAIQSATLALEVNPSDPFPHHVLAQAYQGLGKRVEAQKYLIRAQKLTPAK
jgi:Flp pilus assembly protein TadD